MANDTVKCIVLILYIIDSYSLIDGEASQHALIYFNHLTRSISQGTC